MVIKNKWKQPVSPDNNKDFNVNSNSALIGFQFIYRTFLLV